MKYNIKELYDSVKNTITDTDRLDYIKRYVDYYGKELFPISMIYSNTKSDWKNKDTKIIKTEDFEALVCNKRNGINIIFPIIYNSEVVNEIFTQSNYGVVPEIQKNLVPYKCNWYETNFYTSVNNTWENYNTNSWRNSRRVNLDDTLITFRELTKNDKEYIELIHENWKKQFQKKIYFKTYYKKIIDDQKIDDIEYKCFVTCYRNIPVIFRYYWEYKGCLIVDFENGINSKNLDNDSEYLKKAIPRILNSRKSEISIIMLKLLAKKEALNKDRELYKNRKEWKKVKKIDIEIIELNKEIDSYKNWKTIEINNFIKFIKNSCQNYNRYKFIEALYNKGIEYYYEDGIGTKSNTLRIYKEEKNDHSYDIVYFENLKKV